LPQIGNQLPALPGAVRNYEIEESTFFARLLLLEQSLCIPREFEQPDPFLKVGSIGGLMPLDFAKTPILFGAPPGGHAIEKCAIHLAVELVHVHGIHAALKPVVFRPQPTNCGFVLPLLVGVAGAQGIAHPSENFLVEDQPAEQFRELLADDLLTHVRLLAPMAGRKRFGALVREQRETKEIGLREMAKKIGVSPTYLSKIERGDFDPPAEDKVRKIAEIIGRDADELLALAGRVASDLTKIIRQRPREMADFLRAAKGLPAGDIARLVRQAQKTKEKLSA
jgi:HTH-type transcriptional regulator, competence development regulator